MHAALDWAFSPTGAAEVGVALIEAAVPLTVMEECHGRIEQALSGLAESRDARRNMQLYAALEIAESARLKRGGRDSKSSYIERLRC